ncbi:hypothetical protein H0Z60_16320 [Ectothiorhodospiraceae bacterium WFHF3C12]|nr:hypothetical protein [Ectothiorhodospiraceae bacterium WFHF3C12]
MLGRLIVAVVSVVSMALLWGPTQAADDTLERGTAVLESAGTPWAADTGRETGTGVAASPGDGRRPDL